MEQRALPFRYRLAPLLRRDEWERDKLGGELQRARIVSEQAQRQFEAALGQVSSAEQRMRDLHLHDQTIELGTRRLLHTYLEQAHLAEAMRRAEMKQAHLMLEQVLTQFEAKRLAVRTLEKHRERKAHSHQVEQMRGLQRAADDAWLIRGARR